MLSCKFLSAKFIRVLLISALWTTPYFAFATALWNPIENAIEDIPEDKNIYDDKTEMTYHAVHIWMPRDVQFGHASMLLNNGVYISWWPKGMKAKSGPLKKIGRFTESLQEDIKAEGFGPDYKFNIHVQYLNRNKMTNYWNQWKETGYYALFQQNCCTVVYNVLHQGGAPGKYLLVWTPENLKLYILETFLIYLGNGSSWNLYLEFSGSAENLQGHRIRRSAGRCVRYDEHHKCTDCSYGFYGAECQHQGSSSCLHGYYTESGNCVECNAGFYGPQCQYHCPEHCGVSYGRLECNISTGFCSDGCQEGFFGLMCENRCGHCKNWSCFHEDGMCLHGCLTGYWGRTCNASCPQLCKNRACNREGECNEGCFDGVRGSKCD